MTIVKEPLRLAESATQAALVLAAVLAPYPLDPHRATVAAGVLLGLTLAVYALHAVTFDHFRLTGHRRVGTAADGSSYAAGTPERAVVRASSTRRAELR